MIKQLAMVAMAAGILAATFMQQSYAQYGDSGTGVTSETLQKCEQLEIPKTQCNDVTVLQAERIQLAMNSQEKGSGTSMLTTDLGQMVVFIGVLGAIFGGIASAFFVMGRRARKVAA